MKLGGREGSAAGHGNGPKSVRACERCSMSSQTEKYFLLMRRRYLYESRVYCTDTCSSRELPELGELPETYSAVARYRAERSVLLYQHKGRAMHTVMPSKCYERHGTPRSFCYVFFNHLSIPRSNGKPSRLLFSGHLTQPETGTIRVQPVFFFLSVNDMCLTENPANVNPNPLGGVRMT